MTPTQEVYSQFFGEPLNQVTVTRASEYLNEKYPMATWRVEVATDECGGAYLKLVPKFKKPEYEAYAILKWT